MDIGPNAANALTGNVLFDLVLDIYLISMISLYLVIKEMSTLVLLALFVGAK